MGERQAVTSFFETLQGVLPYLMGIALAVWGGIASYAEKVKRGDAARWNFWELMGEIIISGFSGLMTYLAFEYIGQPPVVCALMAGIAGHMGGRGLYLFSSVISRKGPQ